MALTVFEEGRVSLDPQKALYVPVGAASPLWLLFAGAASAGVAYWWMTRWADRTNLEALLATPVPAAPEAVAHAAAEVVAEPLVETTEALAEAATAAVETAAGTAEAAADALGDEPAPKPRAKPRPAAEPPTGE